jgi:hypothetical protein
MHLTATPAPVRELAANVPAHVEAALKCALERSRDDRFASMEAFLGALRGEAGSGMLGRLSPSGELLAVGGSPARGAERTVAVPSITTFSRATGEVGAAASDDMLLQASRTRRWPIFAVGGAAVAGIVLFLLVGTSHKSAPPAPTGTSGVATRAAAIAGTPLPHEPTGNPGQVAPALPSRADSGVLPPAVAGPPVASEPVRVAKPPAVAGVAPGTKKRAHAAEPHHPPTSKSEKSESRWLLLH